MSKFLNPFTDFGFKKLFGEESSKQNLLHFLNSILPEYHQIQSLEYAKNEYQGLNEFDRKAIVDINCKTQNGETIIIELQKAKQNYFKDRSVYYSTFPIAEQAQRGEWDYKLNAVYMVGILDFTFIEDKNDETVVHTVQLKDQNNRIFYPKLTFIYLTLPNFKKQEQDLKTNQDKWLYLFNNLPKLDFIPNIYKKDQNFAQIFEKAKLAKFSQQEYAYYQTSLKEYLDMYNVLATAKQEARDEGKAEGIAEGMAKGKAEGRVEGKAQGILEIAKSMKAKGMDKFIIQELTGLSLEEIQKL